MNRLFVLGLMVVGLVGCGTKTPESYLDSSRELILCKAILSGQEDVLFYADQRKKYQVNSVPQIYNYIIITVDGRTVSISSLEESNYKCDTVKPSISQ